MSEATPASVRKRHAVLGARARRLARPRKTPAAVASINCLICEAGGALYGVPLAQALRVMPYINAAPAPASDPALLGVVGRSGVFYHVFDLARLAGGGGKVAGGHVVLLRGGAPAVALRVDAAVRVAHLVMLGADEAPAQDAKGFVTGLARALQPDILEGRAVSLLDINQFTSGVAHGREEGDQRVDQ